MYILLSKEVRKSEDKQIKKRIKHKRYKPVVLGKLQARYVLDGGENSPFAEIDGLHYEKLKFSGVNTDKRGNFVSVGSIPNRTETVKGRLISTFHLLQTESKVAIDSTHLDSMGFIKSEIISDLTRNIIKKAFEIAGHTYAPDIRKDGKNYPHRTNVCLQLCLEGELSPLNFKGKSAPDKVALGMVTIESTKSGAILINRHDFQRVKHSIQGLFLRTYGHS